MTSMAVAKPSPLARSSYWLHMANPDGPNERFREVVLPYLADALAMARWLTGSSQDAEDVVQEACLRALASIHTFDGRNARAWVLTIVRNTGLRTAWYRWGTWALSRTSCSPKLVWCNLARRLKTN
jgi:hypothetical protein